MGSCPQDRKSVGGPGSIAEQSIDHGVDVLLGGGKTRYDQVIDGGPSVSRTVTAAASMLGYQIAGDRSGLLAAGPDRRLLGLFAAANMSMQWTGPPAAKPASGPQRCTETMCPTSEPSLADTKYKALPMLESRQGVVL